MAVVPSGYMVTIPLGMWVDIEAKFVMTARGEIERVYATTVDSMGVCGQIPERVQPLVDAYFESWLLHPDGDGEDREYCVSGWLDQDFWQDTTRERLEALAAEGLAQELDEDG